MLDRMFLYGIDVHGRHGAYDFERQSGQRFAVDVDWWLDTGTGVATDQLDDTLCYKKLYDCVASIIVDEPLRLIETLTDCFTRTLLQRFPAIGIMHFTIHKPESPIGGAFADVGVTLTRRRMADTCPEG